MLEMEEKAGPQIKAANEAAAKAKVDAAANPTKTQAAAENDALQKEEIAAPGPQIKAEAEAAAKAKMDAAAVPVAKAEADKIKAAKADAEAKAGGAVEVSVMISTVANLVSKPFIALGRRWCVRVLSAAQRKDEEARLKPSSPVKLKVLAILRELLGLFVLLLEALNLEALQPLTKPLPKFLMTTVAAGESPVEP